MKDKIDYDKYHIRILNDMFIARIIGEKHTSEDNVVKGFKKSDRGIAKEKLHELIKQNLVIKKITGYGMHVSLNPKLIVEIKDIIEK